MSPLHTFQQMVVVMILIGVGFVSCRRKMLSGTGLQNLSKLTADVFNPAIIFSSMVVHTEGQKPEFVGGIFLVAAAMFLVCIAVGWIFSRILSGERTKRTVYHLMFIFTNLGFIGIPVVSSLLGERYVFYVAIYIFEFNVLFYTLGIFLIDRIDGEKKAGSVSLFEKIKPLFNMGTLACAAALLVFATGIKVPAVIGQPVSYLGDAAVPVSLIIIGANVARQPDLGHIFTSRESYLFLFLKMLALPTVCVLVLKFLPMPEAIRQVSMVMMGMPVASMPLVVLTERKIESEECSGGIILTSIASVLTLPAMAWIYQIIMGN